MQMLQVHGLSNDYLPTMFTVKTKVYTFGNEYLHSLQTQLLFERSEFLMRKRLSTIIVFD